MRVFVWLPLWLGCAGCGTQALSWPSAAPADPEPTGPRYLRVYKESHYRDLGSRFVATLSTAQLAAEIRAARVLYLGDHHTDGGLHDRMLALLADLWRRGVRFRLGVECYGLQDQPLVDALLAGEIDGRAAFAAVRRRWPDSWFDDPGLDAVFYRELLRRAAAWQVPVFALEPTPRLPLYERDRTIARSILHQARQHDDLLVVIIGHTHLLGFGQLVERVGLGSVVVGARLSTGLRSAAGRLRPAAGDRFARTDAGVVFFLPPPTPTDAGDG